MSDPRFCRRCGSRTMVRGGRFTVRGGGSFTRYRVCSRCGLTLVTRERNAQDMEQPTPSPE